ncbi:MAG: hypothetical protein V4714_14010 [Bacteroidota bacterium]
MKITLPQNKRLHQLLHELDLMEDKKHLISMITRGRTESSKELSVNEAKTLILHLEGIGSPDSVADRMRKKIFAICYKLEWIYGNSPEDHKMNRVIIDNFIKTKGYLKKPLNAFTVAELPKLVSQFEQIEKHTEKAQAGKAVKGLLDELNISSSP